MEGDLELKSEGNGVSCSGSQSVSVRKNIALHLKPQSSTSNKSKSKKAVSKQQHDEPMDDSKSHDVAKEEFQLSTMKGPSEPLHLNQRLRWSHKVNIVGEKIVDPVIHLCETCTLPILLYGRVIPCKHIFCYDCAKKADKTCPRCHEAVHRVEQSALGTVYVCTAGGSKLGVSGCRRTYLSQRDLQAHVAYRHASDRPPLSSQPPYSGPPLNVPPPGMMFNPHVRDDVMLHQLQQRAGTPPDSHEYMPGPGGHQNIPVMMRNVNLISVPMQRSEDDYQRMQQPPTAFLQPPASNPPYPMMGGLAMQSPPFTLSTPPPGPFSGPPPPVNTHFVVTGPPPMTLTVGLPQGPPPNPNNFPLAQGGGGWVQGGGAMRAPLMSGPRPSPGPMVSSGGMPRPYYSQ